MELFMHLDKKKNKMFYESDEEECGDLPTTWQDVNTISVNNITQCVKSMEYKDSCLKDKSLSDVHVFTHPHSAEENIQRHNVIYKKPKSIVETLDNILTLTTNYYTKDVDECYYKLEEYMRYLTGGKISDMGLAHVFSSNELLVDRMRSGRVLNNAFYSAIPHVIIRSMNMDKTINGFLRMRTYTARGNVVIDNRMYPFDDLSTTTGSVYIFEDDIDQRMGARMICINAPQSRLNQRGKGLLYDNVFVHESLLRRERDVQRKHNIITGESTSMSVN